MNLIVRPEAESDLDLGFHWYEDKLPGLGFEFLAVVREQLSRITERPEAYPRVHPRLRRSLTTRFPYAIFYLLRNDAVVIVAISHQAQDPDHWKTRL